MQTGTMLRLRLLLTGEMPKDSLTQQRLRAVSSGLLMQDEDKGVYDESTLRVASKRVPTAQEKQDMLFAFTVAKHVKSNAIGAGEGCGDAGYWRRTDEPCGFGAYRHHQGQ
jgi:phosphoribosylaminoimidazolecarboxamide formyltransferase/IMP cyclohydrolase